MKKIESDKAKELLKDNYLKLLYMKKEKKIERELEQNPAYNKMTQELKNINVQIEELESKINRAGEIKENRDYWEERVASLEQKLDNLSPEESKQNEKNKEKYEKAKIIWEEYCKKYDEARCSMQN